MKPYCAKLAGPCPDGCATVQLTGCGGGTAGDCWRVKQPEGLDSYPVEGLYPPVTLAGRYVAAAGSVGGYLTPDDDERQLALHEAYTQGRRDEREACAQVCLHYAKSHDKGDDESKAQAWMMLQCAARIRKQP